MAEYKVAEIFESINGEGVRAGQLAVFVRFKGCNLNCSYCDTKWANEKDASFKIMTEDQIADYIKQSEIKNVTLTGGEPLFRDNIDILLKKLAQIEDLYVEIETNGSIDLKPFIGIKNGPSFTMDYKLSASGMEKSMCLSNFNLLGQSDTVKFVAGSMQDLDRSLEIIKKYNLTEKCHVYLSPVFSKIEPSDMVEYMKEHKMNKVNLQIQMHKVIWDPDKRGV